MEKVRGCILRELLREGIISEEDTGYWSYRLATVAPQDGDLSEAR